MENIKWYYRSIQDRIIMRETKQINFLQKQQPADLVPIHVRASYNNTLELMR